MRTLLIWKSFPSNVNPPINSLGGSLPLSPLLSLVRDSLRRSTCFGQAIAIKMNIIIVWWTGRSKWNLKFDKLLRQSSVVTIFRFDGDDVFLLCFCFGAIARVTNVVRPIHEIMREYCGTHERPMPLNSTMGRRACLCIMQLTNMYMRRQPVATRTDTDIRSSSRIKHIVMMSVRRGDSILR